MMDIALAAFIGSLSSLFGSLSPGYTDGAFKMGWLSE